MCTLVEAAFDMVTEYVNEYVIFGTDEAEETFFYRAVKITKPKYDLLIRKEQCLIIDTNIRTRAHDVTVQNLAQYMALIKINNEDRKN